MAYLRSDSFFMLQATQFRFQKAALKEFVVRLVVLKLAFLLLLLNPTWVSATIVLSDDFSAPNGGLSGTTPDVSTGNWTATAAAATPLQISGGAVQFGTSGQDEYAAFSSPVASTTGNSVYSGLNITLSAAQTAGDYFFHLSDPAGTTSLFFNRLFARKQGTGFQLGLVDTSGTGATTTWGSGVLSFNTNYRVVTKWNFVAGTVNDTFAVYVDPTSATEGSNPVYLSHTWTSVSPEPTQLTAGNLRQGSAANSATLTLDNLVVATSFSEVAGIAAVPEPSAVMFGALVCGLIGVGVGGKRLKNAICRD